MILGNAKADQIPSLFIEGRKIERVTQFKLFGVHISDDFRWESHINAIYNTIKCHLDCIFLKSSNDLVSAQMIYFISILLLSDLYLNMLVLSGTIT